MATDDPTRDLDQEAVQAYQRRRQRRRVVYGGIGGGGVIVAAVAIYFLFFATAVYLDLDAAMGEVRRLHPTAEVRRDTKTGYATTISNLETSTTQVGGVDPTGAGTMAIRFVGNPEVAAVLAVPRQAELRVTSTFADPQRSGYNIVRIQQFVEQAKLFGADIAVSVRSGPSAAISSVATRAAQVPTIDMRPAIDEAAARSTALRLYASVADDGRSGLAKDQPVREVERVVFDPKRFGLGGDAALAWRLRVASVQVFVNAKDGRVISAFDDRQAIMNRLTHDCGLGLDCPLVLTEAGRVPPAVPEADAVGAHGAAAAAHAYFLKLFGRDGFDDVLGTGGKAATESFVRVGDLTNAQWLPGTNRLEYGIGWMTPDIAAHEYTHAVTQFGPGLVYLGEAGAVNEFFSDFFAAMIDRSETGTLDWRIGEGVQGFSAARPLRNMSDPHNGGFDKTKDFGPTTNAGQPDRFTDLVTPNDRICASTFLQDNGCVHFNSGILSKALVLAIEGGSFQGTTVTAIAREKVEQIMFRTLVLGGVTASSGLKETADGAVVACNQLVGPRFSISSGDCTAFAKAFTAVGLR